MHGALRCLALIADDLDEASLPSVVPVLFPELYALVADGSAGASLGRRALQVLAACLQTLAYVSGPATAGVRRLVAPYTPGWLDVCSRVLVAPLVPRDAQHCGFQMEALKVLQRVRAFSDACSSPLQY